MANRTFLKAVAGKLTRAEHLGFLGNMYLFLGKIYARHGLNMQWRLAVSRNANSTLLNTLGADCGGDCAGDTVSGAALIKMLDAINTSGALPQTIIYTLNPANAEQIASIAGAFPKVRLGAASPKPWLTEALTAMSAPATAV